MTIEKRRFKRYDVTGVEGTLVFNLDVRVVDLSLTGMSIEAQSALQAGANYTVSVRRREGRLRFPAVARWCHLMGTEESAKGEIVPVYRAGLDFRDALDESARQLLAFIQEHVVVELERRLAGRFTVREGDDIAVGTRGEFEGRTLSLSGMLIETSVVPAVGAVLEVHVRQPHALTARARVAYVEPTPGEDASALLGIEFLELSPAATAAIERTIAEAL